MKHRTFFKVKKETCIQGKSKNKRHCINQSFQFIIKYFILMKKYFLSINIDHYVDDQYIFTKQENNNFYFKKLTFNNLKCKPNVSTL